MGLVDFPYTKLSYVHDVPCLLGLFWLSSLLQIQLFAWLVSHKVTFGDYLIQKVWF